jgi:hypothetical protein
VGSHAVRLSPSASSGQAHDEARKSAALRQVQVGVGAASANYLPSIEYTTFLLKRREENVRVLLELVWALASFGDGKATCAVDAAGFL